MILRAVLSIVLVAACAAGSPPLVLAQAAQPHVDLLSCSLAAGDDSYYAAVLYVRFVNQESRTLTGLTWRVPFGTGYMTFTDRGKFSPGVKIDNGIMIPDPRRQPIGQEYYSLDRPQDCTLIAAKWDDGSVWRDTTVSDVPAVLPTIAPESSDTQPAQFPNANNDPVGLLSCSLQANEHSVGINGHATALWVRFRNISDKPLRSVLFRGHYGDGGFNFTDVGTFEPGVMIKHWVSRKVPPLPFPSFRSYDERASCDVLQAEYADGTTWTNAAISLTEPTMPTPNPNGITKFEGVGGPSHGERPLEPSTPPPAALPL